MSNLKIDNSNRLSKLVVWLTQRELSEDPRDVVANYMIKLTYMEYRRIKNQSF